MLVADKKDLSKVLRDIGKDVVDIAREGIMSTFDCSDDKHAASAPGEFPANLTGALAASMNVKVKGTSVTITDTAYYATMLEAGAKNVGKNGGNIEPRPFLSKALEEVEPSLEARFARALEKYIKGVKQ